MIDIKQLHICGLDDMRPPRVRKEPYIDLHFKLSEKAPDKWCEIFNDAMKGSGFPAKIDPKEGLFIDTWVRKPDEVPQALQRLKQGLATAVERYLQLVREAQEAARSRPDAADDVGEQGRLNRILEQLDFEPPA